MSATRDFFSSQSSGTADYLLPVVFSGLSAYAIYQVFLHPLRDYPGPLVAKFTDGYNGVQSFHGRLHLKSWENQRLYGSVVRQGPNKLVFHSAKAAHDILANDKTTKPDAYMALGPDLTIHTTLTAKDKKDHRSRQQLVGQVLSGRFLRVFESTVVEQVNLFVDQLRVSSKESVAVNMTERAQHLAFNVATLLAFGYDLELHTSEENKEMPALLDKAVFWSNVFLQWPGIRKFKFMLSIFQKARQTKGKYVALIKKMIRSRMRQGDHGPEDLYAVFARAQKTNAANIKQGELWAEANTFLPGAGDTTKTALAAVFFYLSRNPTCYKKVANEIRSTFKSGDDIRGSALAGCRYLRACIDEALRLSPPAPGVLWREYLPGKDKQPLIVDGHVIPRGTIVGVNVYSLHHNEEYFPDPFRYHPERWIDESTTPEAKKIMRDAFIPFALGWRGCPGKSMAYMEISLAIAKTLWHFDFHKAAGSVGKIGTGNSELGPGRERPEEFQLFDHFTASHDGPYLKFRHRGHRVQV
ncbi:cytochrome P450 [Rostrohypoxylon terebratum]|nr:cytochrome P450 [Rostrohypoxylon terebratum]